MKRQFITAILLGTFVIACAPAKDNDIVPGNSTEGMSFVDSLLNSLSVEEKIGQMTQLTLDMICNGEPYALDRPHSLNIEKMDKVFNELHVGSILNCGGHSYPRAKWLDIHSKIKEYTDASSSKIPVLYGIDAIHGVTYTDSSTLFPQQIGVACSWDTALGRSLAEMAAYETRASGIRWNFSPVLDIARDPRWPRFWETFGEDVLLVSEMGESMVQGYQSDGVGDNHVSACLKHFLGYSVTLSGKDRTQAWIPERQLREYFLPQFKQAIDAGAMTIMVNSGEINGIPVHANKQILTNLLRDELGFKGVLVTDWEDVKYLVSRHKVAADYKTAIAMSINAGIDMCMVPVDYDFPVLMKELFDEGVITEGRLDESVRRILQVKYDLGLFNHEVPTLADYPDFASDAHHALALESAKESIVMLRNEDVLPLKKDAKILLAGPNANDLNALNGGWTRTWQGTDPTYNTPGRNGLFDAMKNSGARVELFEGIASTFASRAKNFDAVVLAVGEKPYTETPGDIESLDLPQEQLDLIRTAGELNVPVVLMLIEGRPRTFILPEQIDAVLLAMLPGDFGAEAIAAVLYGEHNPSGKLPFTYPRFASSHATYDHKYTDQISPTFGTDAFNPLFEFGSGMSYSEFEYSDLVLEMDTLGISGELVVTLNVTNKSKIDGKEIVSVFISDLVASITPSVKRLRAFDKKEIQAGMTEKFTFSIPVKELAFVDAEMNWTTEPGQFVIQIGDLTTEFWVK
ncbi:MAG: beta-glucosidase [Flavobacteriales bacterium]|jgi:beta-glucosidase